MVVVFCQMVIDSGLEELGGDARVNLGILEFQDTPVPDPQMETVVIPTYPHLAMAQVNTCAVAEQIKVSDIPRRVTFNVPKTGNGYFDVDRILIYKITISHGVPFTEVVVW
ncbi:unnamed protein product [Parnassius apollo]|uniref:(apollo) hypothetical protein n=1 Tax=Parnassius apollo TaxID=110799 RepID=A0A8S3Y7F1_PARAO|nr:unnamed protein product [Parnassius apollo]